MSVRKYIKDLWDILIERNKVHKALRLLSKQEWSIEFLSALLQRAAKMEGTELEMIIQAPNGAAFKVRTVDQTPKALRDDDIFNHLDDEVKIKAFMDAVR